jgi:hypothetical protein
MAKLSMTNNIHEVASVEKNHVENSINYLTADTTRGEVTPLLV